MILGAGIVEPSGQGWAQVADLLIAFGLSSAVGLERQLRGKSAGLRTQAIVGTAAALLILVSKYGFSDVLASNLVVLDPSRVAAQIVSGIGFLGAGLILTREAGVKGLTTAASVWETAAIGMAAGAGLPLLAAVVVGLHLVIVSIYTWAESSPLFTRSGYAEVQVTYEDGRGILREVLRTCTEGGWTVVGLASSGKTQGNVHDLLESGRPGDKAADAPGRSTKGPVTVHLRLQGKDLRNAAHLLGSVDGVDVVHVVPQDSEE
ncbi:MAG TPA: MgtC/SapB family protein [Acidimicrobiales bacterium]|nr:MgtC/SapB family protein [Acidimicrobiales bacterium]